ncbi:MAG TPA: isocitrate/isopropylmalate dehydrogenase family protein [Methylomirabilota bacterium]|nr:isocitrate/isopropylmalate dehydrogenase family protein [Methylomirabilota bacterium]
MGSYRIAVIPGDGIGPEVIAEAIKVLQAVATPPGLAFDFQAVEAGARCYQRTGTDLPRETLEVCQTADAILFGSAGLPDVRFPDGTEIAPQLTLRTTLDLYVGLRPIKLYPGVPSPLRLAEGERIDYVILRENTEGLYASRGAGVRVGDQAATDTLVITRSGAARICRQAFELARRRPGAPLDSRHRVTCVDKANVLKSYAFFREVFDQVATDYPEVEATHAYVDAMAAYLVQAPARYDVIVTENMFGDILSDLAAATVGGLGLAPSGDIGDDYALFQPSHGTAPDIAGKGIANPLATILSAALLLEWLGQRHRDPAAGDAARLVETAVVTVLGAGRPLTPDLGGDATTAVVGDAVAAAL